jgi:carbamoyltransferase
MNILGISAFYHDSAACLVRDGTIVAAAQEERFSREKHDASFPARAIAFCLEESGLSADDLDAVVFYEKPFIKLERILETFLAYAPRGFRSFARAMPSWMRQKLRVERIIRERTGFDGPVLYSEHHLSHAASAFYPSPFNEAAIVTADGAGEWATTTYGVGRGNQITLHADIRFPHSPGLLYSAFTSYLGFRVSAGECKLMGLASYGTPRYADRIREHLIDLRDDGSFRLDMKYFDYCTGSAMTTPAFHELFGGPPRRPGEPLSRRHADCARSIQEVIEEALLLMGRHVAAETGMTRLCLAGGVALNCAANGRLLREGPFREVWIQPAAGDAGGALGAALAAWYRYRGNERFADNLHDSQRGSRLGPQFDDRCIKAFLDRNAIPHADVPYESVPARAAELIAGGNVVGWFQGRMEFGPRALGGRSMLADARNAAIRDRLNRKVKLREDFRPFAPAAAMEQARHYFALDRASPYMLFTADVHEEHRQTLPAVTHVDGTARLQTVHRDKDPLLHALLRSCAERYGCPVVLNTSLNIRGEPIACTPEDAYRCLMHGDMDALVMGRFVVQKRSMRPVAANLHQRGTVETGKCPKTRNDRAVHGVG